MPLRPIPIRDAENRKQIIDIIYEDERFLAVNKPSGLRVIPDRWNAHLPNLRDLLQNAYEKQDPACGQAIWVAHRIDADTSGLVIFARSAEAHRMLNRLFESEKVEKTYLAVTESVPGTAEGNIDLPIRKSPSGKNKAQIHKKGKASKTAFETIETFRHFALLSASPKTGRTHQIRVHLQAIGCPLAVDPKYGNQREFLDISQLKKRGVQRNDETALRPIINRLTLHAWKLNFQDAETGKAYQFEAPLPKDFSALLKSLRKWNKP